MSRRNPAFAEPFDRDLYWKTKEGTLILLSEMEESHIKNAISYFTRRGGADEFIRPLQKELDFRRFINTQDDDPGDLII